MVRSVSHCLKVHLHSKGSDIMAIAVYGIGTETSGVIATTACGGVPHQLAPLVIESWGEYMVGGVRQPS